MAWLMRDHFHLLSDLAEQAKTGYDMSSRHAHFGMVRIV